jgi:hypothetical protein
MFQKTPAVLEGDRMYVQENVVPVVWAVYKNFIVFHVCFQFTVRRI